MRSTRPSSSGATGPTIPGPPTPISSQPDKAEYFAARNVAGLFVLQPALQVPGDDARTPSASWAAQKPRHPGLPAGPCPVHVLARTTAASSSRTGSSLHSGPEEYLLTSAEPNFALGSRTRVGRLDVRIEEVSPLTLGRLPDRPRRSPRSAQAPRPPDGAHPLLVGREGREFGGAGVTVQPDRRHQRRPRVRGSGRDPRRASRLGHRRGTAWPATALQPFRPGRAVHAPHRWWRRLLSSRPTSTRAQ